MSVETKLKIILMILKDINSSFDQTLTELKNKIHLTNIKETQHD